jgi:class 3 adenylate cyclase
LVGPDGSGALNARVGAGFEVGLVKTIDYRRAMPTVRRLAAILAADVAGYSRLMGADEEGTHERLKAHLRDLIEPKIKEHRGHTVKNTGDGLLAEFPSVVDAVRCAVEVQRGMAERETLAGLLRFQGSVFNRSATRPSLGERPIWGTSRDFPTSCAAASST